ncbi:MAG: methionine gamma-lyase [Rubrivivax sp.]|nr:methionine gamma-lyase [Rubrivivax sp.]
MRTDSRRGFATRAIHSGYDPLAHGGALAPPIYQTATFTFPSAEAGAARFAGDDPGYFYSRIANPTLRLLETRVADLEGGTEAIAFASGMGAITATLWTLLRPGDEIVADQTLYGCTYAFLQHGLAAFGIRVRFVDMADSARLEASIGPATRVVYCESPANPNMRLVDLRRAAALCRRSGVRLVVDNTYCTPYLQRPLELGAHVVVHSATKYLNGHGDVTAGVAVCAERELAEQIRLKGLKDMTGAVLSPHDAGLVLRGLKTLPLRMERHCDNAQAVASLLAGHRAVQAVHYPGQPGFAQHDLACKQMRRFGGMVAFELRGGVAAGRRFLNALELVQRAVSLGDAESLAQHPASMTHATYEPEVRRASGISDGLVRFSAGLEDADDLLADVRRALDVADAAAS